MKRVQDIDRLRLSTAYAWRKALLAPIEAFGSAELFARPGWALMLELYIHRAEKRRLTPAAASRSMSIPEATAIRWSRLFEKRGWLSTIGDVGRGQPSFLRITDDGAARTEMALDAAVAGDSSLGLGRLDFSI